MWAALQRVLHTFWYSPTGVDFGDGFLAYWYCFLWFYGNPSHFLKQWLWEFGHSRYDFDEMFCHAHMRTNWKTFGALWNLASIWWRTFDSMPTICHDVHHGVCEKPLRNWVCETLIKDLVEWNLILSQLPMMFKWNSKHASLKGIWSYMYFCTCDNFWNSLMTHWKLILAYDCTLRFSRW